MKRKENANSPSLTKKIFFKLHNGSKKIFFYAHVLICSMWKKQIIQFCALLPNVRYA